MATFIKCGPDLVVNRAEVASVEWDRRNYMSGPSRSQLIITMNHGGKHYIEHNTYGYGAIDCYKIEKELIGA